jgi:hypothetical protein
MFKFSLPLSLLFVVLSVFIACSEDDDNDNNPVQNPNNPTSSNYCYNFQANTVTYDSIQGGNTIDLNSSNSDGTIEIPIGFNFNLCGKTFNKLYMGDFDYNVSFTIEVTPNVIDYREYELLPIGDLDQARAFDSTTFDEITKLKSIVEGSAPNRVFTLEFRNFGLNEFGFATKELFDYQIKLYEGTDAIEFIYGSNTVTTNFTNDPFSSLIIGHYAVDPNDGIYLYGDPNNPSVSKRIFGQLTDFPQANTRYRFTKK